MESFQTVAQSEEYDYEPNYASKTCLGRKQFFCLLLLVFFEIVLLFVGYIIMGTTYGLDVGTAGFIACILLCALCLFFALISCSFLLCKCCDCFSFDEWWVTYCECVCSSVCVLFCLQLMTTYLLCTILLVSFHPYWRGPFEDIFLDDDSAAAVNAYSVDHDITVRPYFQTTEYSATILKPNTVAELQSLIVEHGLNENKVIRAIGSAHSSSDLFTDDILVSVEKFSAMAYNTANVVDSNNGTSVMHTVVVGAGAVVGDVEDFLYNSGYVLLGFGSAQQQTMAGMLGTGVYGAFGSMTQYVKTVWMVDGRANHVRVSNGDVYPVGISVLDGDLSDYNDSGSGALSMSSDAWIDAVRVNVGLLGIIYQIEFAIQNTFNVQKSITYFSEKTIADYSASEFDDMFNFLESSNVNATSSASAVSLVDSNILGTKLFLYPSLATDDDATADYKNYKLESFSLKTGTSKKADVINFRTNHALRNIFNSLVLTLECLLPECILPAIPTIVDEGNPDNTDPGTQYNKKDRTVYAAKSSLRTNELFHGGFLYAVPYASCQSIFKELRSLLDKNFPALATIIPLRQSADYGYLAYARRTDVCMIELYPNVCQDDRLQIAKQFEDEILVPNQGTAHWGKQFITQSEIYASADAFWAGDLDAFNAVRALMDPSDLFMNDYLSKFFIDAADANSLKYKKKIKYPLITEYEVNSASWQAIGWYSIGVPFLVSVVLSIFMRCTTCKKTLIFLPGNQCFCRYWLVIGGILLFHVVAILVIFFVAGEVSRTS